MEEAPAPPLGTCTTKPHLEKLTLGITRILESSPGVTEVTITDKPPAERHMISSWEQKNSCLLPEDVKNFYLMTNGFHMTWSVKVDEHCIPLGNMTINSLSKLTQLNHSSIYSLPNAPTLADLEDDLQEASENQPEKPHFDSRSVIFELDPCNGNGKVCLVYKRGKPAASIPIWHLLSLFLRWPYSTVLQSPFWQSLGTLWCWGLNPALQHAKHVLSPLHQLSGPRYLLTGFNRPSQRICPPEFSCGLQAAR